MITLFHRPKTRSSRFILGERFSAADVLYGTTFALFGQSPMMPKSTVIDAYVQRVVSRPAFARAQARDNG